MNQPPLELENSSYDLVHIAAQRDHVPSPDGEDHIDVKVDVRVAQLKDSAKRWNVVAEVSIERREDEPIPPYVISLRCWSVFRIVQEDLPEKEAARLCLVTGASMLYSGAREYLSLLTSRGPWGPYPLPTVSFLGTEVEAATPPPFGEETAENAPVEQSPRETPASRKPTATSKRAAASAEAKAKRGASSS